VSAGRCQRQQRTSATCPPLNMPSNECSPAGEAPTKLQQVDSTRVRSLSPAAPTSANPAVNFRPQKKSFRMSTVTRSLRSRWWSHINQKRRLKSGPSSKFLHLQIAGTTFFWSVIRKTGARPSSSLIVCDIYSLLRLSQLEGILFLSRISTSCWTTTVDCGPVVCGPLHTLPRRRTSVTRTTTFQL